MTDHEPPPDPQDDTGAPGLLPPQDLAAERALLGATMLDQRAIDDATDTLTSPADFYRPAHEQIWHAITALAAKNEPVDAITVADELDRRGDLQRIGGPAYLHELIAAVPVATNAGYYADIVADRAHRRRLVEAGAKVAQLGHTAPEAGPLPEVLAAAHDALAAVTDTHQADLPADNTTAVYEAIEALETSPGTPTPWGGLNRILAGWKPGSLYICGARPSVGKSVIATNALIDCARRHQHAILFSLEMGQTEVYHRILADVGEVNLGRIQHRRLDKNDYANLSRAASKITDLPITIDDRAALSLGQIRATIRRIQRDRQPLGLIIIDYLQLITPPSGAPRNDRRVQVDAISRGLKALAKDTHAPVLALTQLNRQTEHGGPDIEPKLSNLREAGGQEQDADVVLLLHRDKTNAPRDLHVAVAKNRSGPLGRITLDFAGEHARAEDKPWTTTQIGA